MKSKRFVSVVMVMMLLLQQVGSTVYAVTTNDGTPAVEQTMETEQTERSDSADTSESGSEQNSTEKEVVSSSIENTEEEAQAPPVEKEQNVTNVINEETEETQESTDSSSNVETDTSSTNDKSAEQSKETIDSSSVKESDETVPQLSEQLILEKLQGMRSTSEQDTLKDYFVGDNFLGTEKQLRAYAQARGLTLTAKRINYTNVRILPKVPNGQYPEGTNFTHDYMLKFTLDGKTVFCIQEASPTWNGATYNGEQAITSFLTDATLVKKLNLIAHFGYYANSDKSDAQYAATELMLWEAFGGSTLKTTIPDYSTRKSAVNSKVSSYQKPSSLKGSTITVKAGQTVTKTDSNGVLSDYEVITNTANVGIKINGNKLEITGKTNSNSNGVVLLQKKMAVTPENSLVYRKGVMQALGYLNDPDLIKETINIKVELNGTVKIKKVDENGKSLANAKFKYTYGSKSGQVTSNSSGEATLSNVPAGSKVTVTEIQAPTGYVLDSTPQTVTVEASKTAILTFKNKQIKGNIKLVKKADENWQTGAKNDFLKGAEFTLYKSDGKTQVAKATTNAKGEISFTNIAYGDYVLKETKVPAGYLPVADMKVSIKTNGQTITLNATDKVIKGNIKLVKKADENWQTGAKNNFLQGAEFTLYKSDGKTQVAKATTNAKGEISFTNLLYGNYVLKETKVPEGYLPVADMNVSIKENSKTIELSATDKVVKGNIKLVKKADINWQTEAKDSFLQGAEFTLYKSDGKTQVAKATTDAKGEISFTNLLYGDYVLKETKVPEGYLPVADMKVSIKENNQTIELSATDKVMKGSIKLVKKADEEWTTDNTNTFLKGAEFTLFKSDGETEVAKATTNEKGDIIFNDVLYGSYILKETVVPEGYLPVEDMNVTINKDQQLIELFATDKVIREDLKLTKVDIESGKPILTKDAQFEIKNLQTGQLVTHTTELEEESSVFVTNEDGVIFVPQLKYGWYEVTEIFAPNGYIQLKEPVKFKVDGSNNGLIELTITNKPAKGKVNVNKIGQKEVAVESEETEFGELYRFTYDYRDLADVTYELYAAEEIKTGDGVVHYEKEQIIDEATTDENGRFEITGLYPGHYYLIEKEAPNGYIKDKEKVPFDIRYEGQEVELSETDVEHKNIWNEFQVLINKEEEVVSGWENNAPIIETIPSQNKVFGLFKRNGFELNGEQVVPENSLVAIVKTIHGVATFQGQLPEGDDYYAKELDAGLDHVLEDTEYPVDLTPQDNREVVQANVYANQTFVGNANLNRMARQPILNKLARQNVKLIKVDNTSYVNEKVLAGVAFDLLKTDGEEEVKVAEFVTDENGEINLENLPTGQYKFVETQPLENYLPNSEDLSFEIQPSTDGEVIIIKAHNERVEPTLGTMLTDLDGQKLIDSLVDNTFIDTLDYTGMLLGKDEKYEIHFELWERSSLGASQDKLVAKTIAKDVVFETENGTYDMRLDVPAGTLEPSKTYYAKEFVYRKTKENPTPDKPFTEHDDRDCKDQTIETKAKPIVPVKYLPQTGETAKLGLSILGLLLVISVGYVWVTKRRKES
ncbi:SpaA isopeptide-forming pilin-related protein [Vagococcus xieshaowenii]|uniref:LPXTG cell wall anchor domain-containing protein n=1 Tax=Vagococcus xieshaowenii TaxID=2562451 RepID=A0AAJ5EH50_9ENTE|nr:SpaA isopeptide-forming pilin-related protein [Vagococcus xieshaowenii]QCA29671.1 LPXTG cell wall anchor domain-containing protein [Vagococcus xieshaowenii]TFZ42946.1 LPXTG cell wall anchor domain-containing protein [Vagococcus xieshaowenii]